MAHEIAHILGIGHDCINDECRFWKNIYVGPRKYDGKDCYGYMDYWMDTTGWSECSAADFASYVNSHASFCLDKIVASSVKNIEQGIVSICLKLNNKNEPNNCCLVLVG